MSLNSEEKVVRQRLSILELAQALGNVSEACRRRGVSRTQFYEYKNRFAQQGLDGLRDLPSVHHWHPQTTPAEVEEGVLALSLAHPAWGCNKLSDWLKLEATSLSAPTIQRILGDHGMSSRYDRWLKLEAKHAAEGIQLNAVINGCKRALPYFGAKAAGTGPAFVASPIPLGHTSASSAILAG
jgi:hypothetical protein